MRCGHRSGNLSYRPGFGRVNSCRLRIRRGADGARGDRGARSRRAAPLTLSNGFHPDRKDPPPTASLRSHPFRPLCGRPTPPSRATRREPRPGQRINSGREQVLSAQGVPLRGARAESFRNSPLAGAGRLPGETGAEAPRRTARPGTRTGRWSSPGCGTVRGAAPMRGGCGRGRAVPQGAALGAGLGADQAEPVRARGRGEGPAPVPPYPPSGGAQVELVGGGGGGGLEHGGSYLGGRRLPRPWIPARWRGRRRVPR